MADKRIPWHAYELTPEVVAGLIPDGMNEFIYPDYPDLPYPDGANDVTWYRDPLINNDEPDPRQNNDWAPVEDNSWFFPYGPHCPPSN